MKNIIFFLKRSSLLVNTIIGVGFFALPFAASKISFFILPYFLFLGTIVLLIHLFYARICLATPDYKRLPGFVQYYLGKRWSQFSFFIIIFSLVGTLLSYLIVGGEFLTEIFPSLNYFYWTTIFFFFSFFLILKDIKTILKFQFFSFFLFFLLIFFLFLLAGGMIKSENFFLKPDFDYWFLPYGVIIFSLWGTSIIPEVEESLGFKKRLLEPIIFFSFFLSLLFYLSFIFFVLGLSGSLTTENALIGLKNFLSSPSFKLLLFLSLLSVFTSFLSLGLTLKKVLVFDLKIKSHFLLIFFLFFPYLLFLLGL
ncbi:MAG: aromatic amino acid transport family protein, partial [Minisyncoccales bacterium]